MSFSTYETSRSLGQPDTVYRFTSGDTVYGYTDAEQPITIGDVTYIPIPIERDAVNSSGNLDKSSFKITVPVSAEIAELFRVFPPSEVVGCVVSQGHADDPDHQFLAVWTGRVLGCTRSKSQATLSCEPVSTSMRRPGLRRRYQYGCPHLLYGPYCRANRADFTVQATVVSQSRNNLKLAVGWQGSFDATKFANGVLVFDDGIRPEIRTILNVIAPENTIIISAGLPNLLVGNTVALSLGCNHQTTDCITTFHNIPNFGGHPWIPKKNPLGNESQYY